MRSSVAILAGFFFGWAVLVQVAPREDGEVGALRSSALVAVPPTGRAPRPRRH